MTYLKDKRLSGLTAAVLTGIAFFGISLVVVRFMNGTPWFLFSSAMRLIFGCLVLFLVKKLYGRSAKDVLSFRNKKESFIAAFGFLLYFVYFVAAFFIGAEAIKWPSADLFISRVILQQLTTGFFEEMLHRVLVCEGCRYTKGGFWWKLAYALINAVLFGTVHILTGWSTDVFLHTGMIGFAFAVIYLQSGNILLPMILHFVYDIFANMSGYVVWRDTDFCNALYWGLDIAYVVMFAVSLLLLIRKEKLLTLRPEIN
ncbi:MAG: CPBP family intramembrane metalloprotease [Ruminococcus sp.]|nr:CPBP family intramembrane metalloprotease [Ruminococcus sp.]